MQYLLLIYADEEKIERILAEDHDGVMARYRDVNAAVKEQGAWIAADRLQRVDAATTLRTRGGTSTTTDGPFAETAEQLGGYYLVDVASEQEAIEIAARLPAAEYGCVEVRKLRSC